ncbi:MAG: MFS transporter [Clostridia bacterium]|nr:MFS transporter [Clostridia bacterium]
MGEKTNKRTTYFMRLIAVSVGHFINDFYMNLIPPILFLFVPALGLSLAQQAFIAFAITSSGCFFQPIIGYFVDKRGKPWLLICSLIWIAFWMSISGIITNYYLLVFVVALGAIASALYHPLGSATAVKLATGSRGKSLSIFMTIGGFAASVSPVVAIPVVTIYGLNSLVFFIVPGILGAVFLYFAQVQKVEISEIKADEEQIKGKIEFHTIKWVAALVFISTNKTLIRSFLVTFGVQIMLLKQLDLAVAGVVLSVYLFGNSAGTIIGGYFDDIIGSKKVLLFSNVIASLFLLMIYFTTGIPMLIAFVLMGLSLNASNTSNIVMAYELMPENLNLATGLIMGLAGGLGGLMMLVYGKIADMQGLMSSTLYLIVPLVIGVGMTMLFPSKRMD